MHEYLGLGGGDVVDFPYFYFALVVGFQYRVDDDGCRFSVGYFGDGQCALVAFLDFGPYLYRAAPFAVVVAGDVDESAGLEVGIERERLPLQVGDGGVEQLVEVVRQDFDRQSHGDAFHALCQQEREFGGQCDGFFVAAVVGGTPFGDFGAV